MLRSAGDAVLDAIGIERTDEVAVLSGQAREALLRKVPPRGVAGDLGGIVRQLLQLDQAVQRRDVGNGQSREVSLAVGAVWAVPARVAGSKEIAGRSGEEEIDRKSTRLNSSHLVI